MIEEAMENMLKFRIEDEHEIHKICVLHVICIQK